MPTTTELEQVVDLDRYPLLAPETEAYRQAVREARAQLEAIGAAEITGFLSVSGVEELLDDAKALAPRAHRSAGQATAYLEVPDFSLPEDHPRLTWGTYSLEAVAYDLMPKASLLRRLYEWQPVTDFIAAILDRGPLYPYADPFGALNLAVMAQGDELQWHFDQTDFVVSLAIQSADHGGDFDVAPRIRSADDECYDAVAELLNGVHDAVVTLPMTAGTLLIFEGRHSLHRVSPIAGATVRLVGLLAYDTKPGTMGSDVLRQSRYGRTVAFADPPEAWPA
ncbi:MAG TPA: hypothetical protein VKR22_14365 [Acidimicrobiales bacterium]|nr:hypothetical protein [Acidimicrobiales bacterium]